MELSEKVEAVDPRHSAEVEAAAVCPRRRCLAGDLLDGAELQSLSGEVQLGTVAAEGREAVGRRYPLQKLLRGAPGRGRRNYGAAA